MLDAPPRLIDHAVRREGRREVDESDGTSEEYTAGEQRTIPFGQTEADRSSGWRETISS